MRAHTYRHLLFDKEAKSHTGEKTTSSANSAGGTGWLREENWSLILVSHTAQNLSRSPDTLNLNRTPIGQTFRPTTDKWGHVEQKDFWTEEHYHSSAPAAYRMGKILTIRLTVTDIRLVLRIYKELKKLNTKKSYNHIQKWGLKLNRVKIWNTNKWEIFFKMFAVLSHQENADLNFEISSYLVRMAKIKKQFEWQQTLRSLWEKEGSSSLLTEVETSAATEESSRKIPQ